MAPRARIVTLTSDFGCADPFVGIMKGVILGICPEALLVDLTHEIPPQDVDLAGDHLASAWRHFPPGTIHLAVVDPGVGSRRRAIAVAADGHTFVAPDNGLLTRILESAEGWHAVEIAETHYMARAVSSTFHGRDVFAPAAAHLARGIDLEHLGPRVDQPVRLAPPAPRVEGTVVDARVASVDRFGNVILDVTAQFLRGLSPAAPGPGLVAEVAGHRIDRFVTHYTEAGEDAACLLVNSEGRLEIAWLRRSAATALGVARGAAVRIHLPVT